ncbi:hypothetical protein K490DRAFT_64539 [Saccharata proteae CBS 121410]|uniref:Clock-controlled protein 6 n=1 Tax=Saccharata proteae CBS 121410 TaxID=1314787 RepID=A0A9P4HYP2_9PEZI|nr:hypothetical protein K490DRAFT_64539 [Saccharata proteae CBS 121410]
MRVSTVAVSAAAMAAGAAAQNSTGPAYVTEVVTAYTTYCPYATEITHGASTYTVTEPTTLTVTNCPCTITRPVMTSTITACNTCNSTPMATPPAMTPLNTPYPKFNMSTPVMSASSGVVAVSSAPGAASSVPVAASSNPAAATSAAATTPANPQFTGAAGKYSASGLLAIAGFAAYFL